MVSKTTLVLSLAMAFVAGAILSSTAHAAKDDKGPFAEIMTLLKKMQNQISDLQDSAGHVRYYEVDVPLTVDENGNFEATGSCNQGDTALHVVDKEDLLVIEQEKRANGQQLFFAGKLKVTGDTMLSTKLQCLFTLE